MLTELENYAREQRVPIIVPETVSYLRDLIRKEHIQRVIEIGTAIGYSAIQMALTNSDVSVITFERDPMMYQLAIDNIAKMKLNDRIKVVQADALLVDQVVLDGEYDLLFIDAAKAQSQKFFLRYTPFVKVGGIVLTDNIAFHGLVEQPDNGSKNVRKMCEKISKYREWLLNEPNYQTEYLAIGDGLLVAKKVK